MELELCGCIVKCLGELWVASSSKYIIYFGDIARPASDIELLWERIWFGVPRSSLQSLHEALFWELL
jgi:hypothetical protein